MKYLLPLLILINCNEIKGVFEWTVVGKVTDYGQNVTLFCHVPNCCPKDAGWDRWTPHQQTLFIDVKSGRPNKKYDGKVAKDGYTLIIQNLTKNDLNVSYSCLYGVTLGEQKFLLAEDVFTYMSNAQPNEGQIAGVIVGAIVLIAVALSVALFVFYSWRRRKKNKFGYQVANVDEPLVIKDKSLSKKDISNISCNEGECVVFTYHSESRNKSIKWLKAGRQNVEKEHWKVFHDDRQYTFKLKNTQTSDNGEYCVQVGKFVRKRFYLNTKVYFVDDPSDFECAEGDDAIFTCKVLPDNTPVKLLKGDKGIIEPEKYMISQKSSDEKGKVYELKLMNIQPSDEGKYCVQAGNSFRDVHLKVKEISMDSTERNKRLERIKSGREIRKYVRIQVIGKEGVGKTSLVRRLLNKDFGKPLPDLDSTNGIEIDTNCQINTINGEWVFDKVTEKQAMIKRIKRIMQDENIKEKESETDVGQHCPYEEKKSEKETHNEPNLANRDLSGNKGKEHKSLSPDEQIYMEEEIKLESEISDNHVMKHKDIVSVDPNINLDEYEAYSTDPRTTKQSNEEIQHHVNTIPENKNTFNAETRDTKPRWVLKKMDEIILDAKERENISEDLDGFVECGIWDFAGQKEYYGTHQTFFTQQAVYIIVADIATAAKEPDHNNDFDSIGKYIDFWFDSIHCFCTNSGDDHLCPPIFMVFTGIDKKEELKFDVSKLEEKLITFSDSKGNHLRGFYNISNTRFNQKDSEECNRLKNDISEYSIKNTYFVELSTEWIQLENTLEAIKEEIYFLSYGEMQELASKILINERNNLNAFLTYQHAIGNMIFFEDIGEFIILKPRWLVECFRCLIFDFKKRDCKVMNDSAWRTLTGTGEISTKLIKKLLQKVTGLNKNEEFILKVMEKFNIIIKPKIKSTGRNQKTDSYYIPCMIANDTDINFIKQHFINDEYKVTPWLVLEFTFLPLAYFYHILFYYVDKYEIRTIGHLPAIYKGKAVFIYAESKQLMLCLSYNSISLQIWALDDINERIYIDSMNELCDCVDDIKGKFSQNVSYSIKAKCGDCDISKIDGRIAWQDLKVKVKYMCHDHPLLHTKKDADLEHTWLKHAKKREEINEEKTRILTNATEFKEYSEDYGEYNNTLENKETTSTTSLEDSGPENLKYQITSTRSYTIRYGIAVIINNIEFDSKFNRSDRKGSDVDASSLFHRFQELGFETDLLNDATACQLEEIVLKIKTDKETLKKTDCLIFVFLSHGTEDSVHMTDSLIKINRLMEYFSAENCPELILKPKIFIFQTDRGEGLGRGVPIRRIYDDQYRRGDYRKTDTECKAGVKTYREPRIPHTKNETDAEAVFQQYGSGTFNVVGNNIDGNIHIPLGKRCIFNKADFLEVYSTSYGHRSFRNTEVGAPFIAALSHELRCMTERDNIYKVLTRVNNKVGLQFKPRYVKDATQMPCFVSYLTKDLYLKQMH